jgi:hypothetical protein
METPAIQRDIGRHDAQIETLQEDMRALKNDVHEIKLILSEARGGWRTLVMVGGISATVGAAFAKIATWAHWFPVK